MAPENLTKLAEQILDDLASAAYYADPEILAGILEQRVAAPHSAEGAAKAILMELLRRYARSALGQANRSQEVSTLVSLLEQHGVR